MNNLLVPLKSLENVKEKLEESNTLAAKTLLLALESEPIVFKEIILVAVKAEKTSELVEVVEALKVLGIPYQHLG